MKFRCERDRLVEAVGTVGRAAAPRGAAAPAYSGVYFESTGDTLRLVATDGELTIESSLEISGQGDGASLLPGRLTEQMLRALAPGTVTIEAADDEVTISSGRTKYAVHVQPVEDFPRLALSAPQAETGEAVTVAAPVLAEALRQVVRAASTEESLPTIAGVLFTAESSGLRLVATDRYRLAVRDLPGTEVLRPGQEVIVPRNALAELQRLLSSAEEVTVQFGERDVTYRVGPVRLSTRLIEGTFPPYSKLILEGYQNRLTVDRGGLLEAVKRVRLVAQDPNNPVRVGLTADGVQCTVITQDLGQATEDHDAKYEGGELVIGFNPGFLVDGLDAIASDDVVMEVMEPMKQVILRGTDEEHFLYVLMPIRL